MVLTTCVPVTVVHVDLDICVYCQRAVDCQGVGQGVLFLHDLAQCPHQALT